MANDHDFIDRVIYSRKARSHERGKVKVKKGEGRPETGGPHGALWVFHTSLFHIPCFLFLLTEGLSALLSPHGLHPWLMTFDSFRVRGFPVFRSPVSLFPCPSPWFTEQPPHLPGAWNAFFGRTGNSLQSGHWHTAPLPGEPGPAGYRPRHTIAKSPYAPPFQSPGC